MRFLLLLIILSLPGFSGEELPLCFIQNQGQVDESVHYYMQGADRTVYFTSDGVTFALAGETRWAVKLDFIGAGTRPDGMDEQVTVYSFFKGQEWKTSIPVFGSIVYRDLWPGIDLVFSGDRSQLKYAFNVKPGADPSCIRLAFRGASRVRITGDGKLKVSTPSGDFEDDVPVAFQGDEKVAMRYVLEEDDLLSFDVGPYDRTRALTLDPSMLVYCGYIGGEGVEKSYDVAVDDEGCAYITGYTQSAATSFPVAAGPDLVYNGGNDAYIAKVSADGTGFVYCGYIGGTGDDAGFGVAVDSQGCAYVTGRTTSDETSFPVKVGPDLVHDGGGIEGHDSFIVKVNAAGTDLEYAGYIGGTGDDGGYSVEVDAAGAAYVTGWVESDETSFPVTMGPDLTYNGGEDLFVAKVSPSGAGFDYLGYIGGSGDDGGLRITVDASGAAYVTGWVQSDESTFPEKVGPDLTYNGLTDAFVAKVNPQGTDLVFCGYIGGEDHDYGLGITVDGDVPYVVGWCYSDEQSFPVKVGPYLTHGGRCDGYVAKVNPLGTDLTYCGYIGGDKSDYALGVRVDDKGQAHVAGGAWSDESTFPVKLGPDLTFNGGGWDIGDAFVARLTEDGRDVVFCGYIGGAEDDGGHSLEMDDEGNMYIVGWTLSPEAGFPATVGPDLTYGGGTIWVGDGFVAKVAPPSLLADTYVLPETGGTVNFSLEAGVQNAGRTYLLLGCVSGSEPGYPLPGGTATLPLNWDPYTDFMVGLVNTPLFSGFLGSLDAAGESTAQLNAPALPAGFVGVELFYAYCLNSPFDFASNPLAVTIVP
jgi:hypothetical protein